MYAYLCSQLASLIDLLLVSLQFCVYSSDFSIVAVTEIYLND